MLSKLEEYYRSLDEISLSNRDLDTKREELKDIIGVYHKGTQNISLDEELLKQNIDMASLLISTTESIKTATNEWVVNFKNILEKEKFRSDLENYFIVIIFGKVKAGKSSLGNFIAHNRLSSQDINFFKYDEAGKEQNIGKLEEIDDDNHGFAIANMECTVEIQGFKLSGMAWVDTPGLGSMVEENGELAKEYIQSADYIIYPTNSSSPLQQDEKEQLRELFEQNKKVTICITKSDDTEEDEVGGKLVKVLTNKSKLNREEQEKWVKTEIDDILDEKQNSLVGNVISLSVHTAKHSLSCKNAEMFEKSNIAEFYDLMTDVVKNKAKSLKDNTPYDGLKSFIDNSILGDKNSKNSTTIKSLQKNIEEFKSQIHESMDKFKYIQKNLNSDITVHIDVVVSKHTVNLSQNNSKKIFETIDRELHEIISNMIDKNIKDILNDFSVTLNNLTTALTDADSFSIEDKYETIKVTYDNTGLLRSIGNSIGIMDRSYTTINETVHVGDNKHEIVSNFKSNRLESFMGVAQENFAGIEERFFKPLLQISQDINSNIDSLNSSILEFKNNLK